MPGRQGRDEQETLATAAQPRRLHQALAAQHIDRIEVPGIAAPDLACAVNDGVRPTGEFDEGLFIFQCSPDPLCSILCRSAPGASQGTHLHATGDESFA
ncbi:hypothetical protein D3C80_1642320 [compost metagenome]